MAAQLEVRARPALVFMTDVARAHVARQHEDFNRSMKGRCFAPGTLTGTCAGTAQGQRQTSRKITSLRCRLQESALSCRGFVRRASQELHLPSNLGTRQRLDLPDTDPRFTARRSAISGCEDLLGAEISLPTGAANESQRADH